MILAADVGCVFSCFIPLFFIALFGGVIYVAVHQAKQQWTNATKVASRWKGAFNDGGWSGRHSISIVMQNAPGYLTGHPSGKNTPALTRLDLHLALPFRLRLTPQDFFLGLRKFFGAEDLVIGDAAFDESFQIESDSVATAKRVLTPDLRKLILRLRSSQVTLDVRANGMTLSVRRYFIPSQADLTLFLDIAEKALTELRAQGAPPGVKIVEVKSVAGNCLTCGTPVLDADYVHCVKCKTPQHQDCWDYAGGCAVYACGETRCLAFKVKKVKPA